MLCLQDLLFFCKVPQKLLMIIFKLRRSCSCEKTNFFSVTKVTDSLARFWNLTSMFILEFNTFKIKLSWWLRKCVLVLCYNKLFLITATKGKQVAVPTKMRTFKSVSFNSSHHDRYKCSFPYLACQPIAIKWSFVFTFISLKRFAVQRKELNNN